MTEGFSEKNKVVGIERGVDIQRKERSAEEHAAMQEIERLVPLLFAAENELIVARQYAKEDRLRHGIADNAPDAGEAKPDDDIREHVERLIDEVAYIKAEMQELLDKVRKLDEEKKALLEHRTRFTERASDDK